MRFLTNLNAINCCQITTNEKLIYFPINSCKLQKHLGGSKIRSLKSALLGKTHALLQDVLCLSVQINEIGERMKLSPLGTLNYTDVCSNTVEVPASEYHVLVKSGLVILSLKLFGLGITEN